MSRNITPLFHPFYKISIIDYFCGKQESWRAPESEAFGGLRKQANGVRGTKNLGTRKRRKSYECFHFKNFNEFCW